MSPSHGQQTAREPPSSTDCKLGSATGLIRVAGDLFALPHAVQKSGHKARSVHSNKQAFCHETTNRHFQEQITFPTGHKKLEPYHPNATRNRPKEVLENVVGSRHRLHPCIVHETYRGSSHVRLADGSVESQKPWKTTNQVFAECSRVRNTVGLANQGIASDIARALHKKQGFYS